jgi:hypothetical protein
MNDSVYLFVEKYINPDGTLKWPVTEDHVGIDALDDAYESFHNWPLFYLAGGDQRFLSLSERQFDAITGQFAIYDTGRGHPIVVKEYDQGYDWFHQGEGYTFFYYLGLANPKHDANKARARQYAGFYLNEDPEAPNYDERLNMMTSPHPGSMGPGSRNFELHYNPRYYADWMQWFGLPFTDLPDVSSLENLKQEGPARSMGQAMVERMSKGDVTVNLAATSLITHAYLWTGEEKYRDWVERYVKGWIRRRDENGGIIPDNVGLSGKVGEYTLGKWYGGYYGWTWPHGWLSIGPALVSAAENAALLTGDNSYLDLPRSQVDRLIAEGMMHEDGYHVPYKHGDQGWFEFRHLDAFYMTHIWHRSRSAEDLERLKLSRNTATRDWERILPHRTKDQGGHDHAWVAYLHGEYDSYPEQILLHNIAQVYRRMTFMQNDDQDPSTYKDHYLQTRNPVTMEGLLQLSMGAPLPIYNGGMLQARIRYYDKAEQRPGLPDDVSALVESMDATGIVLAIVNTSMTSKRELIIQAGTYGEHQFTTVVQSVKLPAEASGSFLSAHNRLHKKEIAIQDKWLAVRLEPGTMARFSIAMKFDVHKPSYEMPWD